MSNKKTDGVNSNKSDTNTTTGNVSENQNNTVSNSDKLFEQLPIDKTPFTAVKMEEEWFLTMGKYRLSEKVKSYEEVEELAKDASWERIMQIMFICIEEDKNGFNPYKKKQD